MVLQSETTGSAVLGRLGGRKSWGGLRTFPGADRERAEGIM